MALTKVSYGVITADASSADLNIDANTLFVDSSANRVGIVNNSPTVALDVTGEILTSSHIKIGGSNNELRFYEGSNYVGFEAPALSADKIWVLPAADGSNGQLLKTDGSGNLSWVTVSSTDSTKMPLAGGTFTGNVLFNNNTELRWLDSGGTQRTALELDSNDHFNVGTSSGGDVIFRGASYAETMRILSDGKVAIGASTADNAVNIQESALSGRSASNSNTSLTLEHATDTGIQFFSATQTQIRFGDAGDTGAGSIIYSHSDNILRLSSASAHRFTIGGTEALRITSAGKVGIGTTSPAQALDVVGAIKLSDGILSSGQAGSTTVFNEDATTADFRVESTSNTHMLFVDGGLDRVGINTSSPTQTLDVNGTVELNNLTVGGSQGSDGQVLTSTGSGVGWESVSAGPTHKTFGTSSIMVGDSSTGTISSADYNTGLGVDVFAALTSGDRNTAVGFAALDALTSGQYNTAVGDNALSTVSTGDNNTAVGRAALNANTTADNNTAVGNHAMLENTTGYDNVGVGRNSLDANTEGHSNTAVGESSLTGNTTGDRNVAIGQNAMSANSTGSENVAVGRNALDANTTADANTAVGDGALTACTTGNNNVCVGHGAGEAIDIGSGNVCIGSNAGDALNGSNGKWNTAVGFGALTNAGPRFQNTAIGQGCLNSNDAHGNTGVGAKCLEDNTSGDGLNGFGYFALNKNTTGDDNCAFGTSAGTAITTGDENVCIGNSAGLASTTGSHNVYIGYKAGYDATDAENNVFIGQSTQNDNAGTSNQVVIGNTARSQGGGKFTVGTSNSTYSYLTIGGTSWSGSSDVRLKKEITDSTAGLSFINDLRPITFKWKTKGEVDNSLPHYEVGSNDPVIGLNTTLNTSVKHGFIAQEVKTAIDNHAEVKDGSDIWEESRDGVQNLSPTALIPMLVKSIQELKTELDAAKARIETLEG